MEGIHQLPRSRQPARKRPPWSGSLLAAAIAAASFGIHYLPFPPFRVGAAADTRYPVSAAIIALVSGLIVRNSLPLPASSVESARGLARRVIPITIVLTGAGLNLVRIASVGSTALLVTVVCIVLSMAAAVWFGKLLGVWSRTGLLIGAGTAICGTSAIVAVAPLIEAEDQDIMLSISTVNILGLFLMFLLPVMGGLMHLQDDAFGIWAGTSIHAVPQVVAAAFAYSAQAGALATLVKLVRVTLLAPFLFAVSFFYARRQHSTIAIPYTKLIPPFVYGFLALSVLNTLRLLPVLQFPFAAAPLSELLVNLGEILLALSMAAMGLEVNVRFLARAGGAALLTGAAASAVLCLASLLLIRMLL
jgi:uncharacterized integral membrane protein (TIGR00698 family)